MGLGHGVLGACSVRSTSSYEHKQGTGSKARSCLTVVNPSTTKSDMCGGDTGKKNFTRDCYAREVQVAPRPA
jgi:hypothetical protein